MPAPPKCPGCGTKLQPDWESCPNCPMSFQDGPPEKPVFQNDNFQNIGIPLIIFGGIAYFLYAIAMYMWHTGENSMETMSHTVKVGEARQAHSRQSMTLQGETKTIPPPTTSGDETQAPETPDTQKTVEEEEKGPGTISVTPVQPRAPKRAAREWKMRGMIYDLITLKPIPGVSMTFTDNATNSRANILSDSNGRYRAILPPLRGHGYLISLSKAGYEKAYLNPGTEGVVEMSIDRRQEIVKELATAINEPASIQPASEEPLITDFHLAPKK